nr:hypothetical protein [Tanacetum cinerariifolium]
MIISKDKYMTYLVPRGLVLFQWSCGDIVDLIGDEDPTDEDGDTEVSVSLGEISLEGKKSYESDIGDCDNTRDGGKITGGGIGKGCSGVKTPLFEGMLVAKEPEEQGGAEEQGNDDNAAQGPDTAVSGDDVEDQSIPSPTPPPQQPQDIPSISQAQSPPP